MREILHVCLIQPVNPWLKFLHTAHWCVAEYFWVSCRHCWHGVSL